MERLKIFLPTCFFVNKNCNNASCLIHNFLHSLRQKIDEEENKDVKVEVFVKQEKISFFFLHCHLYKDVFLTYEDLFLDQKYTVHYLELLLKE